MANNLKTLINRRNEIISYLYKYPTLDWSETKDFQLIHAMKELEDILVQTGNREAAREIASLLSKYYPYEEVIHRLNEKNAVFCNGHALVKTGKTFAKNYSKWAEILYCEDIQPMQYLELGTPNRPNPVHVGNYWYTYMFADDDKLNEVRKQVIKIATGASDEIVEVVEKHSDMLDAEFRYMLLNRMLSDCEYYLSHNACDEKYLWSKTVIQHIADMRHLYCSFKKPDTHMPSPMEWCDIDAYEKAMHQKKFKTLHKCLKPEEFEILVRLFPNKLDELESQAAGYKRGVPLLYLFVKTVLKENNFEEWIKEMVETN